MSRRQACLDYAIARKRLMKLNIFVKQYEQKTSSLGMFSLSEHREKTCFYSVERRKQLSFLEYESRSKGDSKCLMKSNGFVKQA